jgi:hypothetical protein
VEEIILGAGDGKSGNPCGKLGKLRVDPYENLGFTAVYL